MAIFMSFDTEVTADSPRNWLKLDETSGAPTDYGTAALDSGVGVGTAMTQGANGLSGTPGIRTGDKGYTGTGNNQSYVFSAGPVSPLFAKEWALEAWVQHNGPSSSGDNRIFTMWDNGGYEIINLVRYFDGTLRLTGHIAQSLYGALASNITFPGGINQVVLSQTANPTDTTQVITKIIINGTVVASAPAVGWNDQNFGRENYIGNTNNNGFNGMVSEFIVYGHAVSDARFAAHYSAATSVPAIPGGYTATPMTASASMTTPVLPNYVHLATPATATAAMPNAGFAIYVPAMTASAVVPNVKAGPTTKITTTLVDAGYWRYDVWNSGNSSLADNIYRPHWSIDLTNISLGSLAGATISVGLTRRSGANSSVVAKISALTNAPGQAWSATTLANTKDVGWGWGGFTTIVQSADATDIVRTALTANNGISFDVTDSVAPTTSIYDIASKTIDIYIYAGGAITTAPMTASSAMPNPVVTAGSDISYAVAPMLATALEVEPVISEQRVALYAAEVMLADAFIPNVLTADRQVPANVSTAHADMQMPVVVAGQSHSISSTPATADALFVDAVFSNALSISILVPTMTASARFTPNKEANDPLRTPYNALIASQTDSDDIWFRFAEKGSTNIATDEIKKRANGPTYVGGGIYYGEPQLGQIGAPGDMPYVTFDGVNDWMNTGTYSDTTYTGSIEMVFRTTKKNQALFYGGGFTAGIDDVTYGQAYELRDGHVVIRSENVGYWGGVTWTDIGGGFKDVADGEWHHLVITKWYHRTGQNDYTEGGTPDSVSIYIDGKLDKRIAHGINLRMAAVQAVGRPVDASTGYFQGDISTLVSRKAWSIPKYWIEQNSYAALGHDVIRTGQMTGAASMNNARGKGNTIRLLSLVFIDYSNVNNNTQYNASLGVLTDTVKALRDPRFIDSVTSDGHYIDLMNPNHINIDNYDMVELYNTPDIRQTAGYFEISWQLAEKMMDDFYTSLKRAIVEKGISLWINDPEIAKRLGFIEQYTTRNPHREIDTSYEADGYRPFANQEGSQFSGQYDYWGWKNDPFGYPIDPAARTSFTAKDQNPYWYSDTHTDWGQRIVALEDGLTDLPGATAAESIFMYWPDQFHRSGSESSTRYDLNLSGLRLGQEMISAWQRNYEFDPSNPELYRPGQALDSVPDQFVKVGKVIAREIANDWVGKDRPSNPNANNATVIIIRPGDLIDGVPTKGKVFMGFLGDGYGERAYTMIGVPNDNETPYQKSWQWSSYRTAGQYPHLAGASDADAAESVRTGNLVRVVDTESMPTRAVINGSMGRRGWLWITGHLTEAQPGDVIVKSAILAAAGTTPAPITGGQRNASVRVDSMHANAELKDRAEAIQREAIVTTFPMLATAKMTERSININAEPMLASAEMKKNVTSLFGMGKAVDLIFDRSKKTIVVYLRREN